MSQQNIVVCSLIKHNSQILLVRKKNSNDLNSSLFVLPGGNIDFGESPEEALVRILLHIFGYKITTFKLSSVYSFMQNTQQTVGICYDAEMDNNEIALVLQQSSAYEYLWVAIEDIDKYQLSEETITALKIDDSSEVVNNTGKITDVKLYTDGGSRGNPGPSALGFVVMDTNDNVVTKASKYLGITTNNQAEYQAVKAGLQYCADQKFAKVAVYLDSQLVANQMNGIYKIKNKDLWPIHESIKQLMKHFKSGVQFTYIPREYNTDADDMVNIALDEYESTSR